MTTYAMVWGIEIDADSPQEAARNRAAASTQRPLTRRGRGRSVALTTAMTRTGELHAARSARTI